MTMTTSIASLAKNLRSAGVWRGFLRWDQSNQRVVASHPALDPLKKFVENERYSYDQHEAVFLQVYKDCIFGAFLWRTNRGSGAGGVRYRDYDSYGSFLTDGCRLSIGMGRKNALAGLWWGGGKGVIGAGEDSSLKTDPAKRAALLQAYGEFITSLRGCYVAAEDSGIDVNDMNEIFKATRFTTCIDPKFGGSGNPSVPTALGVIVGMEACLDSLSMGTLEGKTIAVQGAGNVGGPMIRFLLEDKKVARIIASDVDRQRLDDVVNNCAPWADQLDLHHGPSEPEFDIFEQQADVLSPCAFGGVLNEDTVPRIKAKIVCGAANNQLLDPSTDYGMTARGITYNPDFLTNRMGIVNCANEQYGRVGDPGGVIDPMIQVHLQREDKNSIFNVTKRVIQEAHAQGKTTAEVAEKIANEQSLALHPIVGHRSKLIIEQLVNDGWADVRAPP